MMRLLSALVGLIFLLATAAVVILFVASEPEPLVPDAIAATADEVRRVENLLDGGEESRADPGQPRELALTPRVLDVLADSITGRIASGHARVRLAEGSAELVASLPVFWEQRPYANIRLRLGQTEQAPRLVSASLGGLPLPPGLLQWLALRWADDALDAGQWSGLLKRMEFGSDGVRVVYRSRCDVMDAMSAGMATEADRRRLLARQQQLAEIIDAQPRAGRLDLAVLLSELLARGDDAGAPDSDAQADNRAAILVLAAYVNGRRLPIADAAADAEASVAESQARPAPPRTVQLRGRRDLAQHFMASAAMVVGGGSTLSHLVGLSKELRDADGGSGFSFPDLMANRAGIRFAELAVGSAGGAQHVQRLARVGLEQDAIMPTIDGLPEGLQRGALERALGDLGSPDYQRVVAYIDRRIDKAQLHLSAPSG